jgi:hypothetical protein
MRIRFRLGIGGLVLAITTVGCIIPVTDVSVTAKNTLTVIQRTLILAGQREKADLIRRMGRTLDLFASLTRYGMPGAPLIRTRYPDGLIPRAQQFVDVLNGGDASGAGYAALTIPLRDVPTDFSTMPEAPEATRDAVRRSLAVLQSVDVVLGGAADLNGQVRGARKPYRDALNALESVITVASGTTEVAGKIAAATWIKAQQEQTNTQLAIEINRVASVQTLMERDAATGGLLYALGVQAAAGTAGSPAPSDSPTDWVIR